VSNSGRIRSLVVAKARSRGANWSVELVDNPDAILEQSGAIVATADSAILDAGPRWLNLARGAIDALPERERVIDLAGDQ
jgi:hypothetical protein